MDRIVKFEVYRKIKTIRNLFDKLSYQSFPTEGGVELSKYIIKVCDAVIQRFDSFSQIQIYFINNALLEWLQIYCGYIQDSIIKNVPWSLIPSFEKLFQDIEGEKKFFIICPLWETNYKIQISSATKYVQTIIRTIFNDCKEDSDVRALLEETKSEVFFIFYPRIEQLSVLHFPLLGHEIGHIYAEKWAGSSFFKKHRLQEKVEDKLKDIYDNSTDSKQDDLFATIIIKRNLAEIIKTYKSMLNEILSDIFCTLLFGPSALLSTYSFACPLDLDVIQETHPPWRARLFFILKTLQITGFESFDNKDLDEYLKTIQENVSKYDPSIYEDEKNKFLDILLNAIQEELNEIVDNTKKTLNALSYNYAHFLTIKDALLNRLQNGIPPNAVSKNEANYTHEKEERVTFRHIILITWLFHLENLKGNYFDFFNKSRMANLLSLKAIEFSNIYEDYEIGTR